MMLHTGVPYLEAAVQAIIPQVDKLIIAYSPKPTQGFNTDVPCPDNWKDLYPLAYDAIWIYGQWYTEEQHLDAVWPYTRGFDYIVRLDSDEIFPPGMVNEMILQAQEIDAIRFRIPFQHFWRSFSKVCRDGSQPIRLTKLSGSHNEIKASIPTLDSGNGKWVVHHMGYAQPTKYIEYKMLVSGHKLEWRQDWLKDRWIVNAQKDVHPVMFPKHWMPEDFDKNTLPDVLKRHKYFNMEIID
jgi:hypothetical protein